MTAQPLSRLTKTALAAGLLLAAAAGRAELAVSDPLTLTPVGGSTLLGQTAMTSLTLAIDTAFVATAGSFSLSYDPAQLLFQPGLSTIDGGALSGLLALFQPGSISYSAAPGAFSLSGTLAAPQDISNRSVQFGLAFQGLQVSAPGHPHPVAFSLSLTDDNGDLWSAATGLPTLSGQLPVTVTAVPEPASYAMLLGGLGLLGAAARRRRAA